VPPHLEAVAAELHRAPRRRTVARLVPERPAAVAACLQALPAAVADRVVDDRDDRAERGVDVLPLWLERPGRQVDGQARPQRRICPPGHEERVQRLAELVRTAEPGRPCALDGDAVVAEPHAEGVGRPEKLASRLVVGRVQEELDEPERPRGRLRQVVARWASS
jgi:hypothetical protein